MDLQNESNRFELAVSLDRKYVGDAAKAVLSTILFHRLFGSLTPVNGEAVGVTFPSASNAETELLLNEKAKEVSREFRDYATKSKVVKVEFYERKVKKTAWFAKTHDVCWESWKIEFTAISLNTGGSPSNASAARKLASREVQKSIMEVTVIADSHKDHLPPITTTDIAPFPCSITIS